MHHIACFYQSEIKRTPWLIMMPSPPRVFVQTRDHLNPLGLDLNLGCKHGTANNNLQCLRCINNAGVFGKDQGGIS